jgi:hypothetical protein
MTTSNMPSRPPGGGSTAFGTGRDYVSPSNKNGSSDRIVRVVQDTEPKTKPEPVSKSFTTKLMSGFQNVMDVWGKISPVGNLLGKFLNSEFVSNIADINKNFQNKAIAYDLQNRVEKQYQKDIATGGVSPGAFQGPFQTQLSKDLIAARAGQFSQQEYQDRYAPQMNQQNINRGGSENSFMNTVAPFAPYMVSGTTPPNSSPAANWYSNLNSNSLGNTDININTEYAKAQTAIANTLTNRGPLGQIAVTQSPFYDWLKNNNLNRGIL